MGGGDFVDMLLRNSIFLLLAKSIYGYAIRYDINPRLRSKHIECYSTYRFPKGNIENPARDLYRCEQKMPLRGAAFYCSQSVLIDQLQAKVNAYCGKGQKAHK